MVPQKLSPRIALIEVLLCLHGVAKRASGKGKPVAGSAHDERYVKLRRTVTSEAAHRNKRTVGSRQEVLLHYARRTG